MTGASPASVLALVQAANPPISSKDAATDAERKIHLLKSQLSKMQTTTRESTRCCDQLQKRARHLESLTTPASDASQKLSLAANNLSAVLSAMREARERFETVSDCEPTILRLHEGVMEMEEGRRKASRAKNNRRAARRDSGRPKNPFDDDDLGGGPVRSALISEQDVYSAADSMEIIKDAFFYFLEHKHWKSAPTALGGIERVHKMGVNSMCTLVSSSLLSAGQALRLKRASKEGGPIVPKASETPEETRHRLTTALENRDLLKAIGEYEGIQPLETRSVREMRAVFECLGGDGYHLGPPRKREPSALVSAYGVQGSKVVRTEKVGSGGYSDLVQKPLKTGFPQLDAYGEARKQIAFKCMEGYYRRLKADRKKKAERRRSEDREEADKADVASRDAVRCLEHAMVVVAGEKSVYRAVVMPSASQAPHDEDAPVVAPWYQKACVAAYSYVVAAVVDRTMDVIETLYLKEGGIGQSSGTKGEQSNLSVRDAASAAAAGLRMLDGVRMLGPSLSKLCEIPLSEDASALVKPGIMPVAATLCIAIHRTTVKNTARTLENLAKAIQDEPLNGAQYRPPDARIAPVSSEVIRAIRLVAPFVTSYKSVTKRRALPWDPNIGDDAGEMESFVKYLIMRLRNSLAGKAQNYSKDDGEVNKAKSNMFMMNNLFYLLKQLGPDSPLNMHAPEDGEHYRMESKWFETDVKKAFETEKAKYLKHWDVLNHHVGSVDTKDLHYSGNNVLARDSGKVFKARFHDFNEEFERLYDLHHGLTVIDRSLRSTLQEAVKNVFLPKYHRFYDKYSGIKFSKKKQDEYLKFPPSTIEDMLKAMYKS